MKNLESKKLIFVDDIEEADLVTHSSTIHADEVFSTIVLTNVIDKNEFKIARVNEIEKETDAIVYDIGYGKYDHHQIGGNGEREDGIKFCSFGLIWQDFGRQLLDKLNVSDVDKIFLMVDRKLVEMIDAGDNGQILAYKTEFDSIPNIVALFNSSWDEESNQNERFAEIYNYMCAVFNRIIKKIDSKIKSRDIVYEKIESSKDNILILDNFMPWKDILIESDNEKAKNILFVIYPSNRGGYNVYSVPTGRVEFESRLLFPKSWAGLKDVELQKITGIKGVRFCHNARFICGTLNLEDAISLAKLAIKEGDISD